MKELPWLRGYWSNQQGTGCHDEEPDYDTGVENDTRRENERAAIVRPGPNPKLQNQKHGSEDGDDQPEVQPYDIRSVHEPLRSRTCEACFFPKEFEPGLKEIRPEYPGCKSW